MQGALCAWMIVVITFILSTKNIISNDYRFDMYGRIY